MKTHHLHPTILRSYDIRGQVGTDLTPTDAYFIGAAFGEIITADSPGKIAVGRDGRISSPDLSDALIDGLSEAGCHIFNIGIGPTPMLYFADYTLQCDAAIQVTGSHNPPDYNGFKLVHNHESFFGTDIIKLGEICAQGVQTGKKGTIDPVCVFDDYIARLARDADFGSAHVIWDAGNGAAGPAIDALTRSMSGTHTTLFTEIDGLFPHHHPNPADPATLQSLRTYILQDGADCGIGFDGDGDRLGVVDAKGRHIAGDILTAYLGFDILERHKAADIIFDVKSSLTAMGMITKAGGTPHLGKTGHSHMKKKLRDMGAPLAGEMSGHIFIADSYYGYDDALYAAVRLITYMNKIKQKTGTTLTDFIDTLPENFATPEYHIACSDEVKFSIIEEIVALISQDFEAKQINIIDGVRVTTDTGWFLIRASNTEGALIARAEGINAPARDAFIQIIKQSLNAVGIDWHA